MYDKVVMCNVKHENCERNTTLGIKHQMNHVGMTRARGSTPGDRRRQKLFFLVSERGRRKTVAVIRPLHYSRIQSFRLEFL